MWSAAYLAPDADETLRRRAAAALARLAACTLCARRCGADRTAGIRRATCRIGAEARVAAVEAVAGGLLDGTADILFAGCNLRCLGCSTAPASWDGQGQPVDGDALAGHLLAAQGWGCRMVVLSSPSHVPAQILDALARAAGRGFCLPLAWASGGYDSPETLALLDGVIDLYVLDFKHGEGTAARVCAGVGDYPRVAARAAADMLRQVGPLCLDERGRARRGLLVRHLVLPNDLGGSAAVFKALPPGTAVQVLDDYRPLHRASRAPKLNRRPSADEVAAARQAAMAAGMRLV